MCATSNPSNRKLGLYTQLPIPSRPWESVSMEFLGGLRMSRKKHDYLYVVVDRFSKMCILMHVRRSLLLNILMNFIFKIFGFILDCQLLFLVTGIPGSLGIFGQIYGE